ncbi:sorting nexin-4 [Agrilus planipennis]|uniref:Sorting nexin-4 n=1 Tax=Agrilus planipennis TaxID=224129 RepID=A0A1W4WCU7_AGRPL|nr:sorting nexin-4 [Agrilus planipennis]XP_018321794.1 sorting nexin-4 [Agrilus planipennis]XP_018321795.1 sorting nexin-4 [Agrilus planipennis]
MENSAPQTKPEFSAKAECDLNNHKDILLKHIDINVSESEKRTNGALNLREFYTVYLIEMRVVDPEFFDKLNKLNTVWRRYTDFEHLHEYLRNTYPYVVIPPLPEKKVMYSWQKVSGDTFDPDFIDRRRASLENFLLRLAAHPVLCWDKCFLKFLQEEEGWKDFCKSSGYLEAVESKLKGLSTSVRLKYTNPYFDKVKKYSFDVQTNLHNLLKARSHAVESLFTIHKLHSNYGRVFSEWSAIEREMGDSLQRIGHYLDTIASCIDSTLEDEELLADQLKEYMFFATSLQNICKHQELLQLKVETAQHNVVMKTAEKEKAQQGKMGLMSRLFGAVDTDEVRELKVNVLDQQIHRGNQTVSSAKIKLLEFNENAMNEIEHFNAQKFTDLSETLTGYAFLQLNMAKKSLQTWKQIRDCLQTIP